MIIERSLARPRDIEKADFAVEEPRYRGFIGGIERCAGCSPPPHHFKS